MSSKYIKWRTPRGGVKREDGSGRLCMHCGKDAVRAAVLVTSNRFKMDVWFCKDHGDIIEGGGTSLR